MAFLTPCFVRVEDPEEREKLIEWLEEIGYEYVQPPKEERLGCKVICESSCVGIAHDEHTFATADYIDAGTNVDLFRALAAMNDENGREQWFTDGAGNFVHNNTDKEINDVLSFAFYLRYGEYPRKATAEEIVKYFKKREK